MEINETILVTHSNDFNEFQRNYLILKSFCRQRFFLTKACLLIKQIMLKKQIHVGADGWLPPVILAIWEADIRRIEAQRPRQMVHRTSSSKQPEQKGLKMCLK
jgi:hypothetical protein